MVLLIGVVYIAFPLSGLPAYVSGKATRCSRNIQKYLGITLLPQAGVALGMAAEAAELSDGHMVRNVVLFSVLVYELVGPTLAKMLSFMVSVAAGVTSNLISKWLDNAEQGL